MKVRRDSLVVAALLAGVLSPLAAQQPVQAGDSAAQGYAPRGTASTPPSAPSAAPAPARPPTEAVTSAPAAPPSAATGRSADALGFIDVMPARSAERIRTELNAARAAEREADARIGETSQQRSQTKAMIDVKKQEISTINARIKLADKQKQEGEKTSLEVEKRAYERQQEFLERREALRGSEFDRARAAKRLAQAQQRALDLELQLAGRRADRARVADAAASVREDEVIRELERKTLEAQQQQAEAAKDVASRDQDIAKRRLELYQAQRAAGDRR